MKELKTFWQITLAVFVAFVLVIVAVLLASIFGCSSAQTDTITKWVYWTSPDPRVGALDRVVVVRYVLPIDDDNFTASEVLVMNLAPAPPGQRDSVAFTMTEGDSFWIGAVSFNTAFPATRSTISNTVFIGGPNAITDLRF